MTRTYDRHAGMASASFRFHGELSAFLARERRGAVFATSCARAATLKHAIEALGVPHTEVMRVTVNGAPATLSRIVREGDAVEVFPPEAAATGETPRFFADAHLGGLARLLRMLGFDAAFDPALHDRAIVVLVGEERRVLLSRDRELLKCREVLHGCYVRALKPESQLAEVAARYALEGHMRPFTRCLHCNLALHALDRSAVRGRVPDGIVEKYDEFVRCPGCDRIYWQGTHWAHMRATLGSTLERPVGAGP